MKWFAFLLLIVVVSCENYAIIYGSIEQNTNTELPSSVCRFYDYLTSIGYKRENIVYMLDTTDYQRDYAEFYTSWHSRENLYLRDVIYEQSCSAVDFQGDYVSPKFFLHYLIGDEKNIKKLSGKDTVRMIHPTKEDNIVVYFSDSHGRGSQFYPDRILAPDLVKKSVLIMKKHKMFKSLLFLVEAAYADYSFYTLERMHNVVALTLKDPMDSGYFTHINTDEETKKRDCLVSLWDTNWISILPLACGKSLRYLYQLSISALLQMPDQLQMTGIWGDKEMLDMSLNDIITPSDECRDFYLYKKGDVKNDEEMKALLSASFGQNFNATLPMEFTRHTFQKYSRFMEAIIREVFMGEIEESEGLDVGIEGCQSFLQYSIQHQCSYFMPIPDPLINLLTTLCSNRKSQGMLIIDFTSSCAKNNPADNLW